MNQWSESHPASARTGFQRPDSRADGRKRPAALPVLLSGLLQASGDTARDRAWADFLKHYSRLILRTVRRASTGHDEAMDRYAFVVDQLRQNDCRRLRAFAAGGRGKFTTWLVVVARRLCIDHHRHVFGRPQTGHEPGDAERIEQTGRRNLAVLLAGEFDIDQLADSRSPQPDAAVIESERQESLSQALSTLAEVDQLLLTLRFEDDRPLADIGPMVGLRSRFQVHRRLKTVLAQLRAALEERGFTHS